MKAYILVTGSCFLLIAACKQAKPDDIANQFFTSGKWIDLTYSFSEQTLYWPNNPTGFKLDTQVNGITPAGFYYASNAFSAPEHGGTHLDAPVHFAQGHQTTDQVPLERLTGQAVVGSAGQMSNWYLDDLIKFKHLNMR